jgi:hypothetical protein
MSSKKKWLLGLVFVAVSAFAIGYGATANAFHSRWYGYFYDIQDTSGWEVLPPWGGPTGTPYGSCQGDGNALPTWVNSPGEFINFIICKRYGNTQSQVGAAFIISTMTGMKNPNPGSAEINEFAARVNYAASQGWINWGASSACNSSTQNTYYQGGSGTYPADVAWYIGCSGSGSSIVFNTPSGSYVIRRFCANPLGAIPQLPDDINFNMSGSSSVDDTTVLPGQRIDFTHSLTNGGPTATSPSSISWTTQSSTSSGGPWSNVSSGNAGTFTAGQTKPNLGNEIDVLVPAGAAPGSQICRRITWSPDTQGGGSGASTAACATVQYDFTLTAYVDVAINGIDGPVSGSIAQPGDSVTFTYRVGNTGLTVSQAANCTYRQATYTGYSIAAPTTVFTPSGANCPPARTFPGTPAPPTQTATETINNLPVNTSICRSLAVAPATQSGGTAGPVQACIHVATSPYYRVYGGDIMAGGNVAGAGGACSTNSGAAVIGWNRRSAGGWAGAAAQFATLAMSLIYDSSTSLGSAAGSAAPPAGLSFRNTSTNVNSGNFGGQLGSAPCKADHFSGWSTSLPELTSPINVGSVGSGTFRATGNVTINGGAIAAGTKTTLYVDGNAYISGAAPGSITYSGSGSWGSGNIPMLRLVVRGNIYIDNDVTQLDGLYSAQESGVGVGGIIYTCVFGGGFAPPALNGTLGTECDNKLTVNGAFSARQVQLLRTIGTLRGSTSSEPSTDTSIAEVFNFNPAFWISQPDPNAGAGAGDYDAITSLPPVL